MDIVKANSNSPYYTTLGRLDHHGFDGGLDPSLDLGSSAGYNPPIDDTSAQGSGEASPAIGEGGSKGKKRKGEMVDGKVKKTRQTQSCDACRARKVKCDRPPPTAASDPNLPVKDTCSHCAHLHLVCTFDYRPKKRGPPNQYVKKLVQSDSTPGPAETDDNPTRNLDTPADWRSSTFDAIAASTPWIGEDHRRPSTLAPMMGEGDFMGHPYSTPSHNSDLNSIYPDWRHTPASDHSLPSLPSLTVRDMADPRPRTQLLSSILAPVSDLTDQHRSTPTLVPPPRPAIPHSSPQGAAYTDSPLSHTSAFAAYPHNPNNPIDMILPRGLLYHIVDLYFDYLYGLCPYLHRPSFMRDLRERREEKPNPEEFVALVCGVVSSTLGQIPRAFVPLPRREVKGMIIKTYEMVRQYLIKPFEDITVTRLVLIYMSGLAGFSLNYKGIGAETSGHIWALLCHTRGNEESSYASFQPVEREIRRRVFWLCIGGDITMSVLNACSPVASESLYVDVNLPDLVEDEYFSESGYREMPSDRTSILSGFYYVSKLFKLTGQVLDKRNLDRRRPPSGLMLQMRINEVNDLYDQVVGLMDDCPPELRLDQGDDPPSVSALSDNWDVNATEQVRALLLDPKASRTIIKDTFLVQQANIYVTQQMTRYILLQYRDDLIEIQQAELIAQNQGASAGNKLGRLTAAQRRLDSTRAMISDEEKEQVASDLLGILQKIPIQVIAVNSVSLVNKIRLVASTLLDALNTTAASREASPSGSEGLVASNKVKRAQSYLWDFLRILSEIEALYSLDDE